MQCEKRAPPFSMLPDIEINIAASCVCVVLQMRWYVLELCFHFSHLCVPLCEWRQRPQLRVELDERIMCLYWEVYFGDLVKINFEVLIIYVHINIYVFRFLFKCNPLFRTFENKFEIPLKHFLEWYLQKTKKQQTVKHVYFENELIADRTEMRPRTLAKGFVIENFKSFHRCSSF